MAVTQAEHEARSSLLTLPQEIRDMIFGHVYQPYTQRIWGKKTFTYCCLPTRLHQVCQQLRDEIERVYNQEKRLKAEDSIWDAFWQDDAGAKTRCGPFKDSWSVAVPMSGHAKYREILLDLEYSPDYMGRMSKGFVLSIGGMVEVYREAQWIAKIHDDKSLWRRRGSQVHQFSSESKQQFAILMIEVLLSTRCTRSFERRCGLSDDIAYKHQIMERVLAILIDRRKKQVRAEELLREIRLLTAKPHRDIDPSGAEIQTSSASTAPTKWAKYEALKKELRRQLAEDDA